MSLWRELSRGSVSTSHKIYDEVCGGPPEFVSHSFFPRPEDYSEIFGSFYVSRASLIPVLDLPPPDETDVFFDVRSSSFDYAEVFGVLDYQDFAVTYEELSKQSNERNVHSPVETRTPAENESLSDNSVDSTRTKCIFNGDSNMSCELSESYHRAYQSRKEDMSNGITQVTQISEVPEVTYLVDGTSSPDRDDEIQPLHENDDEYVNIDLSMGHIEGKQTKKTKPQPPNAVYERHNFDNDPQTSKGSDKSNSQLNISFITISEVSLITKAFQVPPPSRPPPVIGENKSHHHRSDSDCNHVFPKGISNDSSPVFFDVEVDASSSAAPSAELLSAKEMIERKKKGVGTCTKPHLRYDMEEKEGSVRTMLDQSNNDDNEIRFSVMDKTKIVIDTAEGNQVPSPGEKLPVVDKYAEKKLKNYIDYPRERKGAGFFEVKLDHSRKASELVKNADIMIHLSGRNVKTEEDIVIEAREEFEDKNSSKMGVKEAAEHVKIEVTIDKVGYECRRMFEDLELGELVKLNGMHVGTESFQKTKKTNLTERFQVQTDMGLNKIRTEVSKLDNGYKAMKQHCMRDQSIEKVEETQECLGYKESGDRMISECKINNTQLDDARMMHLDINDNFNAVYRGKEEFKHLECQVGPENINESPSIDDNGSITEVNISSETKYCNREADKDIPMVSNLKPSSIGCELKLLGDTLIISKEAKSPVLEEGENQVKEVGTSTGHQNYVRVKNTSTPVSCRQCQDSKYDQERGEQGKALNLELTKNKFVPREVDKERIEEGSKCETNAKPTSIRKLNNPDLASEVNAARSTARRDGEKNTVRVKREQKLENDRLRKMEEEREREREREKDRMIVDRTTLEGRNHAEKAAMERAIADAQQRAMLEARERLEKACEEAREKPFTGKAVLEARVRAERAVVERANAEARERAFEKAVAEKSIFESRIERSFSDRLSASSRNTGIRQSSSFSNTAKFRTQSTFKSSGSRYTHSSSNGERREDIKGESAQRCKARLERHRRIAERAANALAEKNMRDLLAQREQVEKSRLAETLDADVRRWSSGKEGNLRALLSTLQYILLPDSGWQPIPLTQVITTAAVKKAYRKATLCVHPDKLQQRGASIQQKYICEKVYDLLKEAWNKFCSEER